jgi:hypothetical protein
LVGGEKFFSIPSHGESNSPSKGSFIKLGCLSTHPDTVALVDPLFAYGGKRVKEFFFCPLSFTFHPFSHPLFPP